MRFRLLFIIILACVVLLALKIADIIDRRQSFTEAFLFETLRAEEKEKKEDKKEDKKKEDKKDEVTDEEAEEDHAEADKKEEKKEGEGEKHKEEKEGDKKEEGKDGDKKEGDKKAETEKKKDENALEFTQTEVDILQRLSKRREKLDEWQKEIETRENVLNLTQTKIDQKLSELRTLKKQVEEILAQYNAKEDAKTTTLVKIYENMKPKNAADIFSQMDMNTLLEVASKMKEAKLAPILAQMDPKLARELTERFAKRGKLPEEASNSVR